MSKSFATDRDSQKSDKERSFPCTEAGCSSGFWSKSALATHIKAVHQKLKDCKCSTCGKGFASNSNLFKHEKRHTSARVSCPECKKEVTEVDLDTHLRRHRDKDKGRINCSHCSATLSCPGSLRAHIARKHTKTFKPVILSCPYCTKECKGQSCLTTHLRSHTGERPFPCSQCDKKFMSATSRRLHVTSIHVGLRPFKCTQCPKTFVFSHSLDVHLKSHRPRVFEKGKFECTLCDKVYKEKRSLLIHMQTHSGENFECHCGKIFLSEYSFKGHQRRIHDFRAQHSELRFSCDLCDKKFQLKATLKIHKATFHVHEDHKCDKCEKRFKSRVYLQRHYRLLHQLQKIPTKKEHFCNYCGLGFSQSGLMIHLRTHTGETPYPCTQCPKQFTSSSSLRSHRLSVHPAAEVTFACPQCPKKFAAKLNLAKHLKFHDPNPKMFPCLYCNKEFSRKFVLRNHVAGHVGEKRFRCSECAKGFVSQTSLNTHIQRLHRAVQLTEKLRCTYIKCAKTFSTRGGLKTHEETHRGIKYPCEHCDREFPCKRYLSLHVRSSHRSVRYPCTFCRKLFRTITDLKQHLRRHIREKPYQCTRPQCSKRFISNSELKVHLKVHLKGGITTRKSRASKLVYETYQSMCKPCVVLLEKLQI